MTTRHALMLMLALMMMAIAGCSSSSNPVSTTNPPPPPQGTATTVPDSTGTYWIATVNASSYTTPAYYSFAKKDTVIPGGSDSLWDIGIERTEFKTNSGISISGGNLQGMALTSTNFAAVTAADTVGKAWSTDAIAYFINNWYNYNIVTHQLTNNRNVYTMNDATGHHYIKFRIDSLVNPGMPPNMGTVYMTYYYNPTADSKTLSGPTTQVVIPVGSNTVYFSFATGGVVTPAYPTASTAWDLMFSNYNIGQNSGPNGPLGQAAAFYAFEFITDPTNIDTVKDVYAGQAAAPLFPDAASSIFSGWYNYNEATHILTSKNLVYLIETKGKLYKIQIFSYYANVAGAPVSADYIIYWKQI